MSSRRGTEPPRRWVVDTPRRSLRLRLVRQSAAAAAAAAAAADSSGMTSSSLAADRDDVTSILVALDPNGRSAVKADVAFALRLDRLRRALLAEPDASGGGGGGGGGAPVVWNFHASGRSFPNDDDDDVRNARGLMVCFDEVRTRHARGAVRTLRNAKIVFFFDHPYRPYVTLQGGPKSGAADSWP